MNYVTIACADQIYQLASGHTVRPLAVESDEIRAFDERFRALQRALGDERSDEYWIRGLAWLRKARFNILATPLTIGDPALGLLAAVALTREALTTCDRVYPQHAEAVGQLCETAMGVLLANTDAISNAIAQKVADLEGAKRIGVLLPSFGFDGRVTQHLRSLPGLARIAVITSCELQMKRPYDALFVVGKSSWYESRRASWVFTAPRAREIFLTCFAWAFDRSLPPERAFSRSRMAPALGPSRQPDLPHPISEPSEKSEIEIDWELLSRELPGRAGTTAPEDLVEARLFLLADGRAAFVGAFEDSRVQVLDPEAQSERRIDSIPTSDIDPGAFVLLRSEGGGDLIVTVADLILGSAASRLREMQVEWKKRLVEQISTRDLDGTVRALLSLGSSRANRGNVLNWASPRSLRTADEVDFFAVMRLTGLENQKLAYWNAMGKLDRAHRRAGFKIRDELEKEAERADLVELQTRGTLDFTLPVGGGALTAFRVEDISPQTYTVPYQQLGDPFRPRF